MTRFNFDGIISYIDMRCDYDSLQLMKYFLIQFSSYNIISLSFESHISNQNSRKQYIIN